MVIIHLKDILNFRNKTMYWLAKETGISQNAVSKLVNNETTSITFSTLENICLALKCNINDILTFDHKLPTLNLSVLDQYKNEKGCKEFKEMVAEDIANYPSIKKDPI